MLYHRDFQILQDQITGCLIPELERSVENPLRSFTYEYFIKDHLGNIRAVVSADSSGNLVIGQVDSYYAFGMAHTGIPAISNPGSDNKYRYNGKELQGESLGGVALDWYDYGARFYNPQIGRWHVADGKAEKYYDWSPYNYVSNNPLLFLDPDGRDKLRFALNFKMNTGVLGIKAKLFGTKVGYSSAFGGAEQKVSIYAEYDTDTRKLKFGISHTQIKNINETSFDLGMVQGTEGERKETVRDINTEDGATKTEDKTAKNSSEVGLFNLTTDEEGNSVKTDLGTGGDVNLGVFGIEAEAETRYTKTEDIKKDNQSSSKAGKSSQEIKNKNKNMNKREDELLK
jgi:RHS repeat-associated protein